MLLSLTLVVDSNILFAAAIKDGDNAKLLLSDRLYLIAPERLFEEFENNRKFLLGKTHRTKEEFLMFLEALEEKIEVIPREEFKQWLAEAERKSPVNDFPFAALARAYGCAVWSNDKEFKEFMGDAGFVEVLNTGDVLERLGLLKLE